MPVPTVAVGGKITAVEQNLIVGGVNGVALQGIIPTSVAGTGVTLSAGGAVTFTGATTVSLNGVFTGQFDNYRVTWNSPTRSAAVSTGFRLRGAGTDLTSATYDYVKGLDSGTTRSISSSSSNPNFPIDHGAAAGEASNGVMDIFSPALTASTTGTIQASILASSACYSTQISFANETTASYDGFTLLVSSGTFSGTVRVYGYNNLT